MGNSNLVEIGALWKNESKNGRKYLSGRMGNARLLIFFETEKKNDKAPDARIFVAPNNEGQGQGQGQPRNDNRTSGGGYNPGDDDIPF